MLAGAANASGDRPSNLSQRISAKGYIDFRWQHFRGNESWLDSGTGHSRFDRSHNNRPLLADFATEIKADLKAGSQIITQIHAYPEQNAGLEITELYWQYRPLHLSAMRSRWRVGFFYPKLSIENRGSVWSSLYNINYSAINSWIAEELRTFGVEGLWSWKIDKPVYGKAPLTLNLTTAAFAYNDPTGAILAWKGWSNHDLQSGIDNELPFSAPPGVAAADNSQASNFQSFREIDDRPGAYIGIGLSRKKSFKVEWFHYDNQAEDTAFENGHYAWHTTFDHISAHYFLTKELEAFGQYLRGRTSMGNGFVNNRFESAFIAIAKNQGPHRLTARFERAVIDDLDDTVLDDNNEAGNSFNLNYSYYLAPHWKFSGEYQQRRSRQARRSYRQVPNYAKEEQLSFSARYYF
ncbi:hypothetical protein [uncultured Pseudoteredinibacter sp.]|uniref:hypothetical protein n=1 Tax=uncultured Pseudoteredinibacter sp. TaxID=1641701 RepID=UPI0026193E1F|nr:hypothetical protein [uncultured Pseudoteredinibacter sp.]